MTDGRTPPDSDFDWTEAPPRPSHRHSDNDAFNTGERDSFKPPPRPDPSETAERSTGRFNPDKRPSWRERLRRLRRGRPGEGRPRSRGENKRRRPLPPGRRPRRADLPAKVRRRQDIAVGAVAVAVLVGAVTLLSGGGGGGTGGLGIPLEKLVGQTIVGKMGPGGPDKQMLQQVRSGQLGNLVVLPHDPNSLKQDIAKVQKAAREGGNPPLLIMIDQEGGYVKQLPGPPNTAPNDLGRSGDANAAKSEGQGTGSFLAGLGVNVDLAPLLDVTVSKTAQTIATRTYGSNEANVAKVGVGFIQGLQAGGVVATAKHFPGLGLSTQDTDFGRADVQATPAEQEAALAPFKAAIDGGVDMVMVSTAIYPNLGSQQPAALASAIVTGQLRDHFGFKGPIITDDLEGRGVTDVTTPQQAAVAALRAGADLLLFAHQVKTAGLAFQSVMKAASAGRLDQGALETAYQRVVRLKRSLARQPSTPAAG